MQRFVLRAMILLLAAVWAYGLMVRAAIPIAAGDGASDNPSTNVLRVGSGVVEHGFDAPLEFNNDPSRERGAGRALV